MESPWICHICGKISQGEAQTCEICCRTTCTTHLTRSSRYNRESGLYEFTSVCSECGLAELLR